MSKADGLRYLKDAPEALIAILVKVHVYETTEMRRYRDRETFDLFDFPGTSPRAFDLLKDRYGALTGNYRNGFNVSAIGLKFLAKLPVVAA
jgi:hypothetical protein